VIELKCVDAISEGFSLYAQNIVKMLAGGAILGVLLGVLYAIVLFLETVAIPILSIFIAAAVPSVAIISVIIMVGASLFLNLLYTAFSGVFTGGFILFSYGVKNKTNPSYSKIINPPQKIPFAVAPIISAIPSMIVLGIAFAVILLITGVSTTVLRGNITQLISALMGSALIAFVIILIATPIVLIIAMFLSFTMFSIAVDENGVIDGIKASINVVLANLLEVIVFFVLMVLILLVLGTVAMVILFIPMIIIGFIIGILSFIPILGSLLTIALQVVMTVIPVMIISPWIVLSMLSFYVSLTNKTSLTQKE
jgi:hypothetical protein